MLRFIFGLCLCVPLLSAADALLAHHPTMNRTSVVFSYAGDLWIAARDGGNARQLTTGAGVETDPAFSPDGSLIAFTGEYDGNVDVYVVPAAGTASLTVPSVHVRAAVTA